MTSRDGTPDVYTPGGPRGLARTLGLSMPGGQLSYEQVEDAACQRGRDRLAAARGVRRLVLTSNGAGRHPDAVNAPDRKARTPMMTRPGGQR